MLCGDSFYWKCGICLSWGYLLEFAIEAKVGRSRSYCMRVVDDGNALGCKKIDNDNYGSLHNQQNSD